MDTFDYALKRLNKAVDRLDSAVGQREQRFDSERTNLTRALQAARTEQEQTRTVAEGVSSRLDGAIGRLNAVLER
ncbi:MAG: hypothetical protein WCF85_19755 [Rhodospirillaceae bacterium]